MQKASILPDKLILSTVLKKKKYLPFFLFHTEVYSHAKESWKGCH